MKKLWVKKSDFEDQEEEEDLENADEEYDSEEAELLDSELSEESYISED